MVNASSCALLLGPAVCDWELDTPKQTQSREEGS